MCYHLKLAFVQRVTGFQRSNKERVIAAFLQLHHNVDETGNGRLRTFRQLFVVLGQNPPEICFKTIYKYHVLETLRMTMAGS